MNVLNKFSLKNKVGVVTGGSGLYGKCIVEGLCEAKAKVIIASRNLENCERTAAFCNKKGYEVYAYTLDLSSHESISSFTKMVFKDFKQINFLVNNSVLRPMKEGFDSSLKTWRESMDVNATGLFDITRSFIKRMVSQGEGNIINIASTYGIVCQDSTLYEDTELEGKSPPDYFFHRAGVINFTRYLASNFGKHNIRANTISPGGLFSNQSEKFLERYNKRVFLGRMANNDDIKGVVVFLASDASSYVTGANIVMDGGYTCK